MGFPDGLERASGGSELTAQKTRSVGGGYGLEAWEHNPPLYRRSKALMAAADRSHHAQRA